MIKNKMHEFFDNPYKEIKRYMKGIMTASRPLLVLGGVSLACLGILFLDMPPDKIFSLNILVPLIFSLIVTALLISTTYSFNLITDIDEDKANNIESPLSKYKITVKELWAFYLFSCFISLLISIILDLWFFLIVFCYIVLSFAYSYPFFKLFRGKYRRFKEVPVVKNIMIAFCWSLIPIIPIFAIQNFSIGILVISVFSFIQVFIGSVIGDLGDIKGDEKQGIRTIPVILKEKNTVVLFLLLNTISLFWICGSIYYHLLSYQFLLLAFPIWIRYLTIEFIRTKKFPIQFINKKINYPIYASFTVFVLFGKITISVLFPVY